MHSGDHAIGGQNQIEAGWRREHGGIVTQIERIWRRCQGTKVARNEALLARKAFVRLASI